MFGFDQYGHVYIHESTHHSVRRAWEQLFVSDQQPASQPAPLGMTLSHLGPTKISPGTRRRILAREIPVSKI